MQHWAGLLGEVRDRVCWPQGPGPRASPCCGPRGPAIRRDPSLPVCSQRRAGPWGPGAFAGSHGQPPTRCPGAQLLLAHAWRVRGLTGCAAARAWWPPAVCVHSVFSGDRAGSRPPALSVPRHFRVGGGPSAGRKGGGGAGASRELPAHNGQPGRLPEEGGGAGHPSLLVAVWQNPGGGSVLAPPGFDHLPERGRLAPEEVTRSVPAHPPGPAQAGSWDPIKQSTLAPHGGAASYVPGCPCQAAQDAWLGSRACGTLAGAGEGSVSSPLHLRLGTLTPFFGTAQGGGQDSVSCSALPTPATWGRVAGPLCVLFPSLRWAVRWVGPALA